MWIKARPFLACKIQPIDNSEATRIACVTFTGVFAMSCHCHRIKYQQKQFYTLHNRVPKEI